MEILIPNHFKDDFELFDYVAEIQNRICLMTENKIKVYLLDEDFLRNGIGIFLLACLNALGVQNDKEVSVYCNFPSSVWDENRNLMNFFRIQTKMDVVNLIERNISKQIPIKATETVKDILVSLLGEVYNNAVEHSESDYIIGNCYDDRDNSGRCCFFCYDAGIGIIESVRRYFTIDKDSSFREYEKSSKLLKWALKKGNTTKNPPRGVGMDWLLEFARINFGYIRICNENIVFEQNTNGKTTYKKLNNNFCGLFFEMHIMEDANAIYKLKGE